MATIHPPNITVPIMASQPPSDSTPPYSEEFENEATRALLSHSNVPRQINPTASPAQIHPLERPLPLMDPRRTHQLPNTNMFLTEAGGSIYGGPGASRDELLEEAKKILDDKGIASKHQMEEYLAKEVSRLEEEVGAAARRRQDALRANERVEREVREKEGQYEMEKRAMLKSAGMKEK